jgi:hypothetical protein
MANESRLKSSFRKAWWAVAAASQAEVIALAMPAAREGIDEAGRIADKHGAIVSALDWLRAEVKLPGCDIVYVYVGVQPGANGGHVEEALQHLLQIVTFFTKLIEPHAQAHVRLSLCRREDPGIARQNLIVEIELDFVRELLDILHVSA